MAVRIQFDDLPIRALADPNRNPGVARALDQLAAQLVVAAKGEAQRD